MKPYINLVQNNIHTLHPLSLIVNISLLFFHLYFADNYKRFLYLQCLIEEEKRQWTSLSQPVDITILGNFELYKIQSLLWFDLHYIKSVFNYNIFVEHQLMQAKSVIHLLYHTITNPILRDPLPNRTFNRCQDESIKRSIDRKLQQLTI